MKPSSKDAVVPLMQSLPDVRLRPYIAQTLGKIRDEAAAGALLNALNDVLDFSRLETGRFEADPVAFDLHALIHDVAAELQARANDKALPAASTSAQAAHAMSLLTPRGCAKC